VQFPANHSRGNILNRHICEITAQVGFQNSNFSFCDLIAVVMVQIEDPSRDPKPFNGCLAHHQNHAPAAWRRRNNSNSIPTGEMMECSNAPLDAAI
jgi:hypothetical protein